MCLGVIGREREKDTQIWSDFHGTHTDTQTDEVNWIGRRGDETRIDHWIDRSLFFQSIWFSSFAAIKWGEFNKICCRCFFTEKKNFIYSFPFIGKIFCIFIFEKRKTARRTRTKTKTFTGFSSQPHINIYSYRMLVEHTSSLFIYYYWRCMYVLQHTVHGRFYRTLIDRWNDRSIERTSHLYPNRPLCMVCPLLHMRRRRFSTYYVSIFENVHTRFMCLYAFLERWEYAFVHFNVSVVRSFRRTWFNFSLFYLCVVFFCCFSCIQSSASLPLFVQYSKRG